MVTVVSTLSRYAGALLSALPSLGWIGSTAVGSTRSVVVSGLGTTGPFLVTVMVAGFVLNFVSGALTPFVALLDLIGVTGGMSESAASLVAMLALSGIVLVVGLLTETGATTGVGSRAERAVESVPGVGTVYASFDRMSDVLLEGDADSFQEVKLVEFPQADTYTLAFITAEGPASVSAAAEEDEMQVLFVPMAPNPVMGGFMVCVPTDQVIEVDLTVEEAFQAIVTSGVAMSGPTAVDDPPVELPG